MGQQIIHFVALFLVNFGVLACTASSESYVLARTTTGWVRGTRRLARHGRVYASFRGIPYARQPYGELRFQELQPAEPWVGILNATSEGPVCPYIDAFIYGPLEQRQSVSEGCIHVNVHVPISDLPNPYEKVKPGRGLPIVVHLHGGAFVLGSGDADLHGPEQIVSRGVIVITLNYRLGVIGFLSMNNCKIPGNNALRDVVTALRWVQANARYFGGNPDEVTVSGLSAGATLAHLLSMSPAAAGLFKRVWLMSGTAIQSYYTASPVYAQENANMLLYYLGINSTDHNQIYNQLIKTPIEELIKASGKVHAQRGLTSFVPVIEKPCAGFTTIISEDPKVLMAQGKGNNIPMVIGFTNKECESLRPMLIKSHVVEKFKRNPLTSLHLGAVYSLPPNVTAMMAQKMRQRYFRGTPTLDEFVRLCSDSLFAYPVLKSARGRVMTGGAPVYLYKFAYNARSSPIKQALHLTYYGAGHSEDLTTIFQVNSWPLSGSAADEAMKDLMTDLYVNFIKYNDPSHGEVYWPPYPYNQYFYIRDAWNKKYTQMCTYDQNLVQFYDKLYGRL